LEPREDGPAHLNAGLDRSRTVQRADQGGPRSSQWSVRLGAVVCSSGRPEEAPQLRCDYQKLACP
jgi:hypothetical protein